MDAKSIIRKGIEHWNAHDREGFLALYDEGIVYFDQPTGKEFVGREEFGKALYDLWTNAYPDNELKDPIVFGEGDLVCFQGRFVGTNTGVLHRPEMELPPTDKPIDAPFVFVAEVREGKVKRAWHYYDRLLAFEQEGILTVEKLFAQLPVA
jgi:ketosteroid isomerase-like protein